jgi:hypothetical protein
MKVIIQVEDPRGENVSPMDEKTLTRDCPIEIDIWCESILIMEVDSDGNSEGGKASIVELVQEFLELVRPDPALEMEEKATGATENLPDLVRLAATLEQARALVAAEIDLYRRYIIDHDDAHNAKCDESNKLHRLELNKKLQKKGKK